MLQEAATALPPSAMSAAERLDEVASILAAGLRRLRAKTQDIKSLETQRISSTATGHRSGHGAGETRSPRKSQ